MLIRLLIFVILNGLLGIVNADDQVRFVEVFSTVKVCEDNNMLPPDFTQQNCFFSEIEKVNPQGQMIWLQANINFSQELISSKVPLVLHIGALASNEIYWNNELIGRNGIPGETKALEQPGNLDAAFFVPPQLLKEKGNEISIKVSSFHNLIEVVRPMHYLYLESAMPISRLPIHYYLPIMTVGAFVLATIYFGLIALLDQKKRKTLLIALMAFFVGAQLCTESLRILVSYAYPWQIWRLILVTACASGFGISMVAYVTKRFRSDGWLFFLSLTVIQVFLLALLVPGFDTKAISCIFLSVIVALFIVLKPAYKGVKGARLAAFTLLGFLVLIFIEKFDFLNFWFYLAAAV